jgi:hypothetical protein
LCGSVVELDEVLRPEGFWAWGFEERWLYGTSWFYFVDGAERDILAAEEEEAG